MNTHRVPSWESHLIGRATNGDPVAFEILVDQYRPILFHVALRMLRNADDANDAVQEAFLKALRGLGDFEGDRPLRPWLCRICANCCVDAVRRRQHHESLDEVEFNLADPGPSVAEEAYHALDHEQVMAAIDRLPDRYRRIIEMRHMQHLEVNEIAARLSAPEGTVKSWLFRARERLRKDLTPAMRAA
jgi:RNA polymerase sigma-70 factor (ECF subfamily)